MIELPTRPLPASWARTNLGSVIEAHYGKSLPATDRKSDGDVFVMGSSGIVGKHNQSLVKDACVVLGRKGSVGAVYLLKGPSWPIDTTYYVQPTGDFDLHYLYYLLGSMELVRLDKSTAIPGLNRGDLYRAAVSIAPAAEQTRIVAKLEELLSDLDAGVAELKAAQKKLTQYRQSLLKAAVEGALTADWRAAEPVARKGKAASTESGAALLARILTERRSRWETRQLTKFRDQDKAPPKDWRAKYPEPVRPDTTGLPELPQGWFYSGLEAFIPSDKSGTKTGPFGSLLMKHEHKKEGIPVIGIENIDRMKFSKGSKIHISAEKASELQDYELVPGDVVISRSGTVGEVCVIPGDLGAARFSTNIMRVRLECNVVRPEYFCLQLNGSPSVLGQIKKLCSGSTRDFLNTEILKSLVFPVPPISEQDEIESILSASLTVAEQQLTAIHISLKQSAAQRKNILQAAFSGQLVPQDPADEPASALLARIRAERATRATSALRGRSKKGVSA